MKKIIKVIGVLLFSAFLLLPLKTSAQETEWTQELDLSDSVSSSIVKVEDGVVVMQYEGTASSNNLLMKYDFNGNKIWSIKNDYGYNIFGVADGFIIWNENTMTKFDKDKNIIWQKPYPEGTFWNAYNELVEFNHGYVIYWKNHSNYYLISLDKNGDVLYRKSVAEVLWQESSESPQVIAISPTRDGENIAILWADRDNKMGIKVIDGNLNTITSSSPKPLYSSFTKYTINKMIATDEGYLLGGTIIVSLNNNAEIQKMNNKISLDITEIDGDYYSYELIPDKDKTNYYSTAITKCNKNLEEQNVSELPLSFYSEAFLDTFNMMPASVSSFAILKNRIVWLKNDSKLDTIVLNSGISIIEDKDSINNSFGSSYTMKNNSSYGIARYRVSKPQEDKTEDKTEDKKEENTISGVINNIIKNPETNSVIIIAVLLIIVVIVSIISYSVYKKKNNE